MTIDIFCRVIDNYGDIGVCWRLARQLSDEHACTVRLIVDDLNAFAYIAPEIDPTQMTQVLNSIEIIAWESASSLAPARVAIEAFACDPPETYVQAMAVMPAPKPVWINLEYLSAESWIDDVHGKPSPHPRSPLTKFFYCPGFTAASGGLIQENALTTNLLASNEEHSDPLPFKVERSGSLPLKGRARMGMGFAPQTDKPIPHISSPLKGEEPVQLFAFAYPHAPVRAFATALTARVTTAAQVDDFDENWIRATPVPQTEFDTLLSQFDVLIVRGEDSFLRAQYAAKPFLWHIYPTEDQAHLIKLDAWLDRYCHGLDSVVDRAYRSASHAFNTGNTDPHAYAAFAAHIPALRAHARTWARMLASKDDLATRLLRFIAL